MGNSDQKIQDDFSDGIIYDFNLSLIPHDRTQIANFILWRRHTSEILMGILFVILCKLRL